LRRARSEHGKDAGSKAWQRYAEIRGELDDAGAARKTEAGWRAGRKAEQAKLIRTGEQAVIHRRALIRVH
jgi:hypothetical protein